MVALITAVSNPNPSRRNQKVRRTSLRTSERGYRTIAFDILQHSKFTCHVLRELSNFCCLPGRAGGSPNGLDLKETSPKGVVLSTTINCHGELTIPTQLSPISFSGTAFSRARRDGKAACALAARRASALSVR